MTTSDALDLTQAALWAAFLASAPIILAVLVVGLVVAIVQAVTQIQEMTLTFAPKIVVAMVVLMVSANFIGGVVSRFADRAYSMIERPVGAKGAPERSR